MSSLAKDDDNVALGSKVTNNDNVNEDPSSMNPASTSAASPSSNLATNPMAASSHPPTNPESNPASSPDGNATLSENSQNSDEGAPLFDESVSSQDDEDGNIKEKPPVNKKSRVKPPHKSGEDTPHSDQAINNEDDEDGDSTEKHPATKKPRVKPPPSREGMEYAYFGVTSANQEHWLLTKFVSNIDSDIIKIVDVDTEDRKLLLLITVNF